MDLCGGHQYPAIVRLLCHGLGELARLTGIEERVIEQVQGLLGPVEVVSGSPAVPAMLASVIRWAMSSSDHAVVVASPVPSPDLARCRSYEEVPSARGSIHLPNPGCQGVKLSPG